MRQQLLALEQLRSSKVLTYITVDRQNLSTQIDEDVIEVFHEQLESLGEHENIDLFLYSRGGSTFVPLPLVRLIRKYCTNFGVIVPFRAHSAATMICIGADEIYMTRKAELGPVDTQLIIATNEGQRAIATTDLFAYLEFAKSEIGWQQSNSNVSLELLEYFHKYCSFPPDLIGKIYRLYTQSRRYVIELANNRAANKKLEKEVINQLAEMLVNGFGSHDYKIDAVEAKNLGLNVLPFEEKLEASVNELYRLLAKDLKLNQPFIPNASNQKEEICQIMTSDRKAVKYAIVNSITTNAAGQSVADIKIQPWEYEEMK